MATKLIIGCTGYAGTGKTTLANALAAALPGAEVASFADALKAECDPILKEHLGISAFTQDPEQKKLIRGFLVARGAGRRAYNYNHWIDVLAHSLAGDGPFVVDDVRYANEARWVRGFNGMVFGLQRAGVGPANTEERISMSAFTPDVIVPENWIHNAEAVVADLLRQQAANLEYPGFQV